MGNCLAVSVPTMVSQNWFPETERLVATGILSLSMPIGMVLGQGISPTFVKCPEDIPVMNIVWFLLALLTFLSCLVFITSSHPASPPSRSAELARAQQDHDLTRAQLFRVVHSHWSIFPYTGLSLEPYYVGAKVDAIKT